MTKEEFICEARKIHGDKYDYSKVAEFKNKKDKICIVCPEHGEFWQMANEHLKGHGCSACCGLKKLTTEQFIEKARKVHGNKYDYSKVEYKNNHTKVCIICPEHGEFWQVPNAHLSGCGCKKCAGNEKYTTIEFIERARRIHGDKYDYTKVEYSGANKKVCIICPEHGIFWQKPSSHLLGCGCPKCGNEKCAEKNSSDINEFIEKARKVHGNKYDYSKVEYKNQKTTVRIICPEHGEFFMTPGAHLAGQGCRKCSNEKLSKERTKPNEQWIEEAKKIHGDRYSYEKTVYRGYRRKVTITCPIHGDFEQLAYDHHQGKGCPKCRRSWMENDIEDWLVENGLKYIHQYRPKFLVDGKSHFSLDFFLPDYNVAIECNGAQHFVGHTFYSKNIEDIVRRDKRKKQLCEENGIRVLYYTSLTGDLEYFDPVIRDKTKLLTEIKNGR